MDRTSEAGSQTPRGLLLGAATSIVFGASVVVNKAGLDGSPLSSPDYTTLSALVACLLALPPVLSGARAIASCSAACAAKILAIGIFASGVASLLLFWGQRMTTATDAGFLLTLSAFFTVVFAAALLGERIERRKYPAIALLFVGLYLLIVGTESLALNTGDLLIVGTAMLWGITNTIARSVMRDISGQLVAWLRLVIGAAFLAAVVRPDPGEVHSALAGGDLWFIASGVMVWLSILLFYKAIEMLGAGMASLIMVSSPVVATAGAVVLLGEVLSPEDLLGGVLILVSMIGITGFRRRGATASRGSIEGK
jgi:O-acetylserine/cysteine efflux transporter